MNEFLKFTLEHFKLTEPQHFNNLTVFPLLSGLKAKQEYVMLAEALHNEWIEITEISESGSVPELFLKNHSEQFVLILDGEELIGAKQNRVLNTTLLIPPEAKMEIPVSCTEQGRWSYSGPRRNYRPYRMEEGFFGREEQSENLRAEEERAAAKEAMEARRFKASEHMMFARGKSGKMRNVHESLKKGMGHRSNQGEVWDDIASIQSCFEIQSETSAMRDVYEGKKQNLEDYTQSFQLIEGQQGILVAIDGKLAGLEYLSRTENFAKVFTKLVESYSFDALARSSKEDTEQLPVEEAEAWLKTLLDAKLESFPARGAGQDYRLESEELVGAGLVEKEEVINLSAFPQPQRRERDDDSADLRFQRIRQRNRRAMSEQEFMTHRQSLNRRVSGLDSSRHGERIVENLRRRKRTEES